jgi:hypothetical protein
MKVQEQHVYHGIALAQIVRHQSFKALNSGSAKHGHYLINSNRHVLIKYRKNDGNSWRFTFQPSEIAAIRKIRAKSQFTFVCLVCGNVTVCALLFHEIETLLSFAEEDQQSITVDYPAGASLRVRGTNGELPHTIRHNDFPQKLFE